MREDKQYDVINNKMLKNNEFYELIKDILNNEEFIKRKEYHHHENRSVYVHSIYVSYYSYKIAKFLHMDYTNTAIGGLLHDFYYNDWQKNPQKGIKNLHGFVHAGQAATNSNKHFPQLMNKKVDNIIRRHMFPLTIIPPKYFEGWIVTCVDKFVSLEVLKSPKQWYKYVGLAIIFKRRIR